MNHNTRTFCILVLALAALGGCSSNPPAGGSKKPAITLDKIQGKAQVMTGTIGSGDAALNPGGPAVNLWVDTQRYRLFTRETADVVQGKEYVVEGINAQRVIDEIGDPDQGKGGYPLQSSCERVVTMAWSGLAFDALGSNAGLLRERVARYPARPVFLVTRIRPATDEESKKASADSKTEDAADEKDVRTISVAAAKQSVSLIEGSPVQPAPLWQTAGGTISCKVVIGTDGKVSELETGAQLCEAVQWSKFRYQPAVQGGRPVKVKTEVEVRFEPRK